jgi:thioredoxin-like negative regulator of GroEL
MKTKDIILLLILGLVLFSSFSKNSAKKTIVKEDTDSNKITIVNPSVDLPTNKIFEDNLSEAKKVAEFYKKPLLVIFGADWCVYCKSLKQDLAALNYVDKYVVCIVDIEKNSALVKEYKIKGLPTSIIMHNNTLEYLKGYKKHTYEPWLKKHI